MSKFKILCIASTVLISCSLSATAAAQGNPPPEENPVPPPPPPESSVPPPPGPPPVYVPAVEAAPTPAPVPAPVPAAAPAAATAPVPWGAPAPTGQPVENVKAGPAFAAEAAKNDDEEDKGKSIHGQFVFGSYGRAQASFDSDGNRGLNQNVTAHGPRLFEPSYAEVDLAYRLEKDDGFDALVLFTFAIFEPLAHYSGFASDELWAVRNLMVEMGGFIPGLRGLRLWVGSRMYRGDDIYLFDYWPLDNLNTIGGGAIFTHKGFDARIHVGVNRLKDSYQYQKIRVPGAMFGSSDKMLLDRQRVIGSGRIGYTFENIVGDLGLKVLAYGEVHHLTGGRRVPTELVDDSGNTDYVPDDIIESVPEERGFVIGGQVGLFGFGKASHLNLFVRYAKGLAAYGELGVPFGTDNDGTTSGAYEVVGGISANWESRWIGVMLGGYLRRFRDADVNSYDTDDFGEGAVALRPVIFITDHLQQGFEVSYQRHTPYGLDFSTNRQEIATMTQFTIMEIVSLDRGNYERPQIRVYYTLGLPNASAQDMYEAGDTRRLSRPEHFFGLGAEWWFNSSSHK